MKRCKPPNKLHHKVLTFFIMMTKISKYFMMQFIWWFASLHIIKKQGNSVARDLPPTGSEANTTYILHLYIYWI